MEEEWPETYYNNPAIKTSELIKELQKILEEHGDLPVFATADYEWIANVRVIKNHTYDSKPKHVVLEE